MSSRAAPGMGVAGRARTENLSAGIGCRNFRGTLIRSFWFVYGSLDDLLSIPLQSLQRRATKSDRSPAKPETCGRGRPVESKQT